MDGNNKQPKNSNENNINNGKEPGIGENTINSGNDDKGYVKQIFTQQDVYTSGIVYRYINNVDPNLDLITDTAKFGGPLHILSVGNDGK